VSRKLSSGAKWGLSWMITLLPFFSSSWNNQIS
jgi:hypothetical protein